MLLVDGAGFALATGLADAGFATGLGATAFIGFAGTGLLIFFAGAFFAGAAFLAAGFEAADFETGAFDAGLVVDFPTEAGLVGFLTGLAAGLALATGLRGGAFVAVRDTVFARAGAFAFLTLAATFGLLLAIPKPIL